MTFLSCSSKSFATPDRISLFKFAIAESAWIVSGCMPPALEDGSRGWSSAPSFATLCVLPANDRENRAVLFSSRRGYSGPSLGKAGGGGNAESVMASKTLAASCYPCRNPSNSREAPSLLLGESPRFSSSAVGLTAATVRSDKVYQLGRINEPQDATTYQLRYLCALHAPLTATKPFGTPRS